MQPSRDAPSPLLYENMAYRWWISWRSLASLLRCNSSWERRPLTTTLVPPHPSHLRGWRTDQGSLFSLVLSPSSPPVFRSPADSLAVRNALFVAGFFACPSSPCAPFPVSSFPCLCSDTVWLWLVLWLVTVLQGPCQMAVLRESAGLALFRSLTVPLWGSVPSCCRCFTLLALGEISWLLVVFCGTGWASTSIDNL